mmetsp:Transcript_13405/g.42124  ORF Transcript_13405/g.42124 Transcript_13405/m.42124 type:complete len:669 (-) Transcript_13405:89-2095(-)
MGERRRVWEVVGGKKDGGILVRSGKSLTSPELPGRLAVGATIQGVALDGARLEYEKISGDGPKHGWISLSLKGKELVRAKGKIALLSIGSRGDWQPIVILARALTMRGHHVHVFGQRGLVSWVGKFGLAGTELARTTDCERAVAESTAHAGSPEEVRAKAQLVLKAFDQDQDGHLNFEELRAAWLASNPEYVIPWEAYEYICAKYGADPAVGLNEDFLVSNLAEGNDAHEVARAAQRKLAAERGVAAEEPAQAAAAELPGVALGRAAAASDEGKLHLICPSMDEEDTKRIFDVLLEMRPDILVYFCHFRHIAHQMESFFGCATLELSYYPHRLPPYGMAFDDEPQMLGIYQELIAAEEEQYQITRIRPYRTMGFKNWRRRHFEQSMMVSCSSIFRTEAAFSAQLSDFHRQMVMHDSYTGYWFMDQVSKSDTTDEEFGGPEELRRLEAFLAAGPAVYLGWGSCVSKNARFMTKLAVAALKEAGMRGVVGGGWARLSMEQLRQAVLPRDVQGLCSYAEANVLFVAKAPHVWLFERCCCAVHHGGTGTLGAALRSGNPTIVTPCWGDQDATAGLVSASGCGLGLPNLADITSSQLAEAIKYITTDEGVKRRAKEVRELILREGGVFKAADNIGKLLEEVWSGNWWRTHWGNARPRFPGPPLLGALLPTAGG